MLWLLSAGAAVAGDPAQEFWPEIDVWLRLSPEWRLSVFVPISENIDTQYREGNVILQGDYAFGKPDYRRRTRMLDENRAQNMKPILLRGGYLGGKSLGDQGEAYTERTMFAEWHVRTPLKGGFLLSQRLRADLRWLGEEADFSTRWRYRSMVEREYRAGRTSLVPYVNVEGYFDSRYDTINRIRAIPGASVGWSPWFAIESNVTDQHDTRSSTTNLVALNVILHVYFETHRAPSQSAERRRP